MAQDGANRRERDPLAEHLRGRGMAEDVCPRARALHVRAGERPGGNRGHRFRAERAEWGHGGQQHRGTGEAGAMVGGIGEARLPHIRRQGEPRLPPVFPSHTARAVRPRDVVPLSGCDIPGAES
jgi:hypothetical protein